ncbi:MAG: hypothetical protein KDC03_23235, partial [Flavobacteriales bacterium]|nr:hypothetical protein [Flavobacteriales bacterium]
MFTPPPGALYLRWNAAWTAGDYYLNFDNIVVFETPPPPCTGTPTPGNTTGPDLAGNGVPFSLGLQNATSGTGVTYQWFVSTVGAGGPWTPFGTNTPTVSTSQTVDSWYYCEVTCTTGPNTGSSNVLAVEVVPVNVVPFSGSNSFACGTNMVLQDHNGNGNYSAGADGFTVLDAGVAGVVNITGTYDTESCCDRVRIYDGVGTGGTELENYAGTGSVNFTGAPGQTVTVRFTSDGSVNGPGFDFLVTYTGTCAPSCSQPVSNTQNVVETDCITGQFSVDVSLDALGDATDVDFLVDVNGGGPTVFPGGPYSALSPPNYNLGPFNNGDVVDITIRHNQDNTCNLALGSFESSLACPGVCGLGIGIPDASCPATTDALLSVVAPGTQLGTDVVLESVDLIIDHTFNADLEVRLTSPNNVTVDL